MEDHIISSFPVPVLSCCCCRRMFSAPAVTTALSGSSASREEFHSCDIPADRK